MYGQTESGGISVLHPDDDVRPETVGKPTAGTAIKISEAGEILISSPSVFLGYYKNPEATAQALDGGWLHTGDAGVVEDDGHLVVIDRLRDVLRLADGSRFSPALIENKLKFSPHVREAVVVGEGRPFVVALIQIDMGVVGNWAESSRLPFTTFKDLSGKPEVFALIGREVARVNDDLPQLGPHPRLRAVRQGAGRRRRRADADQQGPALDHPRQVPRPDRRPLRRAPATGECGPMTEQFVFLMQLVIAGVAVGAVYSLMALGFVLIYKASTVVNFGPGELVLFGAYVAWATILNMKLPLAVALPLTLVVAILLGLIIERGVLRPLIGEPIISVIMVTFGFASVVRGVLNMTWGSDTRPFPALFASEPFRIGPDPDLARAPLELRDGRAPAGRLLALLQVLPAGHRHAGHRGQPAGGAVAGRERQGDLRAVVVHRHGGLGAGRHHPGQRSRWRGLLARRLRSQDLPGGDPRRPRQRGGRPRSAAS